MPQGKSTKMLRFINWELRVALKDRRELVGTFLAFDRHMNLVLGDAVEYKKVRVKGSKTKHGELKRKLGLVLLRGEMVVSISPEAPPKPKSRAEVMAERKAGPGRAMPMGRGMPAMAAAAPPMGLAGPVMGMGGPPPPPFMGRGMAPPPMPMPPQGQMPMPPHMMMGRGRGMMMMPPPGPPGPPQ